MSVLYDIARYYMTAYVLIALWRSHTTSHTIFRHTICSVMILLLAWACWCCGKYWFSALPDGQYCTVWILCYDQCEWWQPCARCGHWPLSNWGSQTVTQQSMAVPELCRTWYRRWLCSYLPRCIGHGIASGVHPALDPQELASQRSETELWLPLLCGHQLARSSACKRTRTRHKRRLNAIAGNTKIFM